MFLITKNRVIIFLCLFALIVAGTIGGIIYAVVPENTIGTIVLDAGHGGWDSGVRGASSGIKESELNLTVSYLLEAELKSRRFNVVLTRMAEKALGDTKRADMEARQEIIDKARPDMVISIHMNKYSDRTRRGAQVFYDDTGRGETAANTVQGVLNTHLNAKYSGRSKLEALPGDYYITKCYPCPSMIIECGFLSNIEDERLLMTNSYQKTLVKLIADGIEGVYITSSFSQP